MRYDQYPGYYRVSTVADAVGRLESDGLMHVGSTWASQRALEIANELLEGIISPDVAKWQIANEGKHEHEYFGSQWFANAIKAGATRKQQAAADRGTITNNVWDALNRGEILNVKDAIDYAVQDMDLRNVEAKLSQKEYAEAIELGLVDPKDKTKKPVRNYQCDENDVLPFVIVLATWFKDAPWRSIESQRFMVDEKRKIVGTFDDIGYWGDQKVLADLKTSTSEQPKLYNVCQAAQYWRMAGSDRSIKPMNIIVTLKGVYPRYLSDEGIKTGLAHFDSALSILKGSSMKGLFLTTNESKVNVA